MEFKKSNQTFQKFKLLFYDCQIERSRDSFIKKFSTSLELTNFSLQICNKKQVIEKGAEGNLDSGMKEFFEEISGHIISLFLQFAAVATILASVVFPAPYCPARIIT